MLGDPEWNEWMDEEHEQRQMKCDFRSLMG